MNKNKRVIAVIFAALLAFQGALALAGLSGNASGTEKADHIFSILQESTGTPQTFTDYDQLASIAIAQEDYETALDHLVSALALIPEDDDETYADTQMRIGSVEALLGHYEESLAALNKAAALMPGDTKILLLKAQIEIESGAYEAAIASLLHYLVLEPEDGSVAAVLAQLYDQTADYQNARKYYDLAVSLDDKDLTSLLNRARCDYMLEDDAAAIAGYDDFLARADDPDSFVHFMRGICRARAGLYAEAAEDLESAIAGGYAEQALCYEQLSLCYYALGEYENALKAGGEAAQKGEGQLDYGVLYQRMGIAAMSLERYDEAIGYLTESLEIAPDLQGSYYYRGVSCLAKEDYKTAIGDFTASIEQDFLVQFCVYNRGVCHVQLGDYDQAVEDMQVTLGMNEDMALVEGARDVLLQLALHFKEEADEPPRDTELPQAGTAPVP